MANVIRAVVTPAIQDILSRVQTAFLPQASIGDAVRLFNRKFFEASTENRDLSILFHDFAKAYDSVSRQYLFTLLQKIGLPTDLTHLLQALFRNVKAFPILPSPHKITIRMGNGLKQGCPLSPLLFILCMDPLLTQLEKLQTLHADVVPVGFCDDVATCFEDWGSISTMLSEIEAYNIASGGRSNLGKTCFISTNPDLKTSDIQQYLPLSWQGLRVVDRYKHLGVLIGREVTVEDVYAEAIAKLSRRVARYKPLQGFYSLQNRIIISNSFLSTVFSYLSQFFLMNRNLLAEAKRVISTWVVRDLSTRMPI